MAEPLLQQNIQPAPAGILSGDGDPSGLLYTDPNFRPGKVDISTLPVLKPLRSMMKAAVMVNADGMMILSHSEQLPEYAAWVEFDADLGWLDIVTKGRKVQNTGITVPKAWYPLIRNTTQIGIYHINGTTMINAGVYAMVYRQIGV